MEDWYFAFRDPVQEYLRINPDGTIEVAAIVDIEALRHAALWAVHPEYWSAEVRP